MSEIHYIVCDNCQKKESKDALAPVFHKLILGGSDMEVSSRSCEESTYHFCSIDCMVKLVSSVDFQYGEMERD
jgi:hypothetical protein